MAEKLECNENLFREERIKLGSVWKITHTKKTTSKYMSIMKPGQESAVEASGQRPCGFM